MNLLALEIIKSRIFSVAFFVLGLMLAKERDRNLVLVAIAFVLAIYCWR